ncbi:hypothetical protein JB92DRAFT_2831522 [Gautieria morchelliformis]|nr:hypothetical protein JB92DRAFT_2831522 [Gautieria morchelliformis]
MSGGVEDVIVLGGQFLALLIYEHFLTFGDEVNHFNLGRQTYASKPFHSRFSVLRREVFHSLDVLNIDVQQTRYYDPICLSVITYANTTRWGEAACKTVGPLEPLGFLTVVLTASSILLLLRVYALYNRNKWILGCLSSVIAIQFALSIFVFIFPGGGPLPMPQIDLPVFQGCLFIPSDRLKNGTNAPIGSTYPLGECGLVFINYGGLGILDNSDGEQF